MGFFDSREHIGYSSGRILKIDYNSLDRDRLIRLVVLDPTGERITSFDLDRIAIDRLRDFLGVSNKTNGKEE